MYNTSYIELSESALQANLDFIRSNKAQNCTLSHVVKGNAYGHGIHKFVPLLFKNGARHFSVFDAGEAYEVLKALPGKDFTVMVMGMIENQQVEWAVEQGVEFYVFDLSRLQQSIKSARKLGKPAKIHLEIETGMNRTGFEKEQWYKVAEICLSNAPELEIKGICTHYAGAESIGNHIRVARQQEVFKEATAYLEQRRLRPEKIHSACSAAFMRVPNSHQDMVRIGILQYGFWPSIETYIATAGAVDDPVDPLKRVISWKSQVMNTKQIKKGEYIGYGSSYLASSDMTIASVPVGYGHGFSRALSNTGRALIHGSRVQVVGIVNMNVMMIDISHLQGVQKGDEVVLIGNQEEQEISVSSFSDYSEQLNYELLTRLPHDIPRDIVN